MAMIWPFVLMGFMAVMGAIHFVTSFNATGQSALNNLSDTSSAAAEKFIAVSNAATAYAEANPGYMGNLSMQQLSPYMDGRAFPSQWQAAQNNGVLFVWSNALSGNGLTTIGRETENDCGYGVVVNGTIQSECTGMDLGTGPSGVPDGAIIHEIGAIG